jgi:YD repeat-containing protein
LTDGCPNNCHGNGSCQKDDNGEWYCICIQGFRGSGCDIGVELICDDGLDNDADFLFDCDDPDCCNMTVCENDDSCTSAPDPTELVANVTSNTTVSFFESIQFLFDNYLQIGVDVAFINQARVAVVKGRITTRDTTPLIGVTVAVLNEPAYGHTLTRQDGSYDIAVNGGSAVTITYNRRNFIGSQRSVVVPVNNYVNVEEIVMIPVDAKATEVDLTQGKDVKVAEGSRVVDDSGSRQGILMFPPNTEATVVTVNGTQNQTVERPVIRVTEYTVGGQGEEAMPAELPPFTGYTYAVEMSVDQATVNGSTEVVFNQTLPYYVENYLGFPVGSAVPTGYYNRTLGEWVPSRNGRVVLVLNITTTAEGKKLAVLDVTGDGVPATSGELNTLGVTNQELEQVGSRYNVNQSLWRVPIRHFTPWDCNWPYGPPPDGCTVSQCDPDNPVENPKPDDQQDDDCKQNGIVPQKQAQQQQLEIPGSGVSLVYSSNRALGYKPVINIPLTSTNLPQSLLGVHLRVEVQGQAIKKVFPPQPNLNYRFAWDRRDSYRRTILGQVEAVVNIGYEYGLVYYPVRSEFTQSFNRLSDASVSSQVSRSSRQAIFWEKRTVPLGGPSGPEETAGLGGWSLSLHHSYDPPTGVLYTGTGRKTEFRDKSKIVQTAAGTGTTRPMECPECLKSQEAVLASLLAPVAIAVAADGSVFIGDFQLIRRFYPNGNISTVVDFGLGSMRPLHAYYLAVSPVNGDLFISYGQTHRVYRISSTLLLPGQPTVDIFHSDVAEATVFAGTGYQCHGWEESCGDGDLAVNARLSEPKGIGVGARGTVYFADGKVIRQVGIDGLITTFAGSRFQRGCSPPGCSLEFGRDVPLDQAYFGWPTDIAVKLDEESLYVIDRKRLVHVTREGLVRTVAGISPHVSPKLRTSTTKDDTDQFVPIPAIGADLKSLRGLVVANDGSVFFGETDGGRVNRIRILDQSGYLVTLTGSDPGCNCAVSSCKPKCFGGEGQSVRYATFYVPSAFGLSPDGDTLYIADQGNARIRSVRVSLPKLSEGFYTIPSVDGKEAYQFDVSGRHVSTVLTSTGQVIYTFDYSEFETNNGRKGLLVGITDVYNNTLAIERSSNGQPLALHSPFGVTTALVNDISGHLKQFRDPTGRTTEFTYGTGGLMESMKEPGGLLHSFRYDENGRLTSNRRPDGGSSSLSFQKTRGGKKISLTLNSGRMTEIETSSVASEEIVTLTEPSGAQTVTRETSDGVRRTAFADGTNSQLETSSHPVWGQDLPVLSRSTVKLPSGKSREMTTRYFANFEDDSNPLSTTSFGHVLQVDNSDWINVEYTRATNTRRILNLKSNIETRITYNKYGEEIERSTTGTGLDPIRTEINQRGFITSVSQGQLAFNFTYVKPFLAGNLPCSQFRTY